MAKRFSETKIWDDEWHQSLPAIWKLAWKYLCDNCDEAGIYKVNKGLANYRIGEVVNWDNVEKYINNGKIRIKVISEHVWVIVGFIEFQYGEKVWTSQHGFHKKIRGMVEKYSIYPIVNNIIPYRYPIDRTKEEEEEEEKVLKILKPLNNNNNNNILYIDIQAVVEYYKQLLGFDKIEGWDKANFARHAKYAKNILLITKTTEKAKECINWVKEWLGKEGLEWNLSTVAKHADKFISKPEQNNSYGRGKL